MDLNKVLAEINGQIKQALQDQAPQLITSLQQYIDNNKQLFETWAEQLVSHKIDEDEFADLVKGELQVGVVMMLTQAGMKLIVAQRLRDRVLVIVIERLVAAVSGRVLI